MLEFLIASIITCDHAIGVISRVRADERLSEQVRVEIVAELIEHSDCDSLGTQTLTEGTRFWCGSHYKRSFNHVKRYIPESVKYTTDKPVQELKTWKNHVLVEKRDEFTYRGKKYNWAKKSKKGPFRPLLFVLGIQYSEGVLDPKLTTTISVVRTIGSSGQ